VSRHFPGNPTDIESRVAWKWAECAAPDAQVGIMFFRMAENAPAVIKLQEILFRHFEKTRQSVFVPTTLKPFEIASFSDYFTKAAAPKTSQSYTASEFAIDDFSHFQDWLTSYSYVPNDAFITLEDVEKRYIAERHAHDTYDQLHQWLSSFYFIPPEGRDRVFSNAIKQFCEQPARDRSFSSLKAILQDFCCSPQAATELETFYRNLESEGGGQARIPFGTRIYTGPINRRPPFVSTPKYH
jgi:hypothetical protein